LYELFDAEEYYHIPVTGEIAQPAPLDDIFLAIHDDLIRATALLAVLDNKSATIRNDISTNDFDITIASVKAEIASRLLRTGGAGVHLVDADFPTPVTLMPVNIEPVDMSTITFINPNQFDNVVIGKIQNMESTPFIPVFNPTAFPNVAQASIQIISRKHVLNLEDINSAIQLDNLSVNHLTVSNEEVTNSFGSDSAVIRLESILSVPQRISMIVTPLPEEWYISVELTTITGEKILYNNVEENIFIDTAGEPIEKITWVIPTFGIPEETLGGFYDGRLTTLGSSSQQTTYGVLVDTLSTLLRTGTPPPPTHGGLRDL